MLKQAALKSAIPRLIPARYQRINHQQNNRTHDRRDEASRFTRAIPAHGRTGITGKKRAGDAHKNGHDPAQRISAWFKKTGDKADDETDENSGDDGHEEAFRQIEGLVMRTPETVVLR